MRRAIIEVMVTGASLMLNFMSEIQCFSRREPISLHGKTVQGQKQQQENDKESAHWSNYGGVSQL
jgi:hypothetical protein